MMLTLNDRRSSHSNSGHNPNGSFANAQWGNASFQSQSNHTSTLADEATIDLYAGKVLQDASPADLNVDADYLGPYITGVLRAEEVSTVEDLDDYDNMLELLQEHCGMSRQDAKLTLQKIAQAVTTGTVPVEPPFSAVSSPALGPFSSPPASGGLSALKLLETFNVEEAVVKPSSSTLQVDTTEGGQHTTASTQVPSLISPMQPNNLIPVDLLGAIDNLETPTASSSSKNPAPVASTAAPSAAPVAENNPLEEEFPSLAAAASVKKKSSRASRSRQGSIDESSLISDHSANNHHHKKVSPSLQPTPVMHQHPQQEPYYYSLGDSEDPATMLQMACDMLTQMNPDMGQDAIFHACTMANANVPVAQYLMDCAMTAPPVCRHLLHSGCYRSDCSFSHDLEGHTCVFWLRGHCNKGTSCPFLHGYNEKWLIQLEEHHQQQAEEYYSSCQEEASSWEQHQHNQSATTQPLATSTHSFANIASQGYNDQTCFQGSAGQSVEENSNSHNAKVASMRIPQDVWNPHERRDASAFHIADPMERYYEVSRHTARQDVVDLHFQSTKTFGMVLREVLPDKLRTATGGGLWIVTGTGHHVGSKTHQKGGGILESAVQTWLAEEGYEFWKGKDRNGHGGAVFVKQQHQSQRGRSGSIQQ